MKITRFVHISKNAEDKPVFRIAFNIPEIYIHLATKNHVICRSGESRIPADTGCRIKPDMTGNRWTRYNFRIESPGNQKEPL